jgi:hypothetical protein
MNLPAARGRLAMDSEQAARAVVEGGLPGRSESHVKERVGT